jgi:hypothetical protein
MKAEEADVRSSLDALKQRKWISTTDSKYTPVNPADVVKAEIGKFEANIKKIKSDALVDLVSLYVQNNLMHVRYSEFMDLI